MNEPWYMKKKMWVGLVTAAAMITADLMHNPELATKILAIGMTVIGAFGLEDMGKGKVAVEEAAKLPPPIKIDPAQLEKILKEHPDLLK